jgi:hypothetical protein
MAVVLTRPNLRGCLCIVASVTPPQHVFARWTTTKRSTKGRTAVITRRKFVKASATSALAAGLPIVTKVGRQTGFPEMNPANTFWPDSARMVISVSMQMEAGAQPSSGAESPMPKIDPKYPDLPGANGTTMATKRACPASSKSLTVARSRSLPIWSAQRSTYTRRSQKR